MTISVLPRCVVTDQNTAIKPINMACIENVSEEQPFVLDVKKKQLQFLCLNCFGNRDIKLHLAKTVVWSAGRSTKNQFELFPPCPSTSDACSALPCQRHASSDRRLACSLRELKSTERSRKPVRTPPTASGYLRCLLKLWSSPQEGVYCQDSNEALKVFRE